jgi:hypothetical protein
MAEVTTWRETSSRKMAHVLMNDFPTAADAFFEIIDNPLDYRHGREIEIDVQANKDADSVSVEDRGGEGMDAEGIADWLQWGSGHPHSGDDIGRYHKGGKAACGYLADSVRIVTRRSGQSDVWMFQDLRWKTREDWADFGVPEPYTKDLPDHLTALPAGLGFTRIELSNLVTDHRWNLDRLRWRIGNTYRALISKGGLTIRLNGVVIPPLDLPLSSAFKERHIDVTLPSKHRVRGWVGRLDRDATRPGQNRIPGGIRCLYQNRLITEGEYFGHHAEGKGLLASLIGEIELNFVAPLSNKTDFQRGTAIWEEVERAMYDWLAPIIAEFRRAAESQPVTLEERKRVNAVRRQLEEALRAFADAYTGEAEGATLGRRPPTPRTSAVERPTIDGESPRSTPQPRTPAPEGAVGTLRRLRGRIGPKGEVPPIVLKDLDPGVRSEADEADGRVIKVVINRAYPMYRDLKEQEAYIAETALLELLQPRSGEVLPIKQFLYQVNDCLGYWYKTSRGPSV